MYSLHTCKQIIEFTFQPKQRSQLTVVRWSETTRNYVGPPEHSYPVVVWTTKISSPNHNRNVMPQKYEQSSSLEGDNTRNIVGLPSLTLLREQNTYS